MVSTDILALAPMWYVAFLLSLTCHEAAHALAAKWGGDETAALGGQVSLNPIPHIQREPLGTVLVPLLSLVLGGWMIGWASAPYDPYWRRRHPHRAAWMALAGPAANLILAVLAGVAVHAGILLGRFLPPESIGFTRIVVAADGEIAAGLASFLSILFSQNVLLMSFNLLPVPPLDGSSAIGLLMPEDMALRVHDFMSQPGFALIGLIVAWNLFDRVFSPIFLLAVNLLYPGLQYG
jgi:Zn-dependent protease